MAAEMKGWDWPRPESGLREPIEQAAAAGRRVVEDKLAEVVVPESNLTYSLGRSALEASVWAFSRC